MTNHEPPGTLGAELLQRARANGMTSEELAALLNTPVRGILAITDRAELDRYPVAALRTLAERLQLPWPAWLSPGSDEFPDPPQPATVHDPVRVQAVLAAAFGQPLHLGEIAQVLGWTTDRVRQAADQLATRVRWTSGLQLTDAGDTLTLDVTPRLLSPAALRRLAQLLHAAGLGPDPHVFHLIYRLMPTSPDDGRIEPAPDVLDEAADYQLVTYDLDERHEPTNIKLTPEVAYSLGLIDYLPEDEPRLRRGWPPTDET
jgi:hypothetical protein